MHGDLPTVFMARTTRVSNPVCSPGCRPSQSEPFSLDAFAIGSPPWIIAFYRSPRNTSNASRSLVPQCTPHFAMLSTAISRSIYGTCYERFRPNNIDCHLGLRCYRGGWHRYFPPLIRQTVYAWQKPQHCWSAEDPLITLSHIVKVSRLLHPVGLGPISQCPSPGYRSHGPYRSVAWWSITPPTT